MADHVREGWLFGCLCDDCWVLWILNLALFSLFGFSKGWQSRTDNWLSRFGLLGSFGFNLAFIWLRNTHCVNWTITTAFFLALIIIRNTSSCAFLVRSFDHHCFLHDTAKLVYLVIYIHIHCCTHHHLCSCFSWRSSTSCSTFLHLSTSGFHGHAY